MSFGGKNMKRRVTCEGKKRKAKEKGEIEVKG
jgi:hypothetical protein